MTTIIKLAAIAMTMMITSAAFTQEPAASISGAGSFSAANASAASGCSGASFIQPASSPVASGASPSSVAVGDFNLDHRPDLAVSNAGPGSTTVSILLSNRSGGFKQAPGSPVGVGLFPQAVAVGDFNLDDTPDLAVANSLSGNVTILLGSGDGRFVQPAGSPVRAGNVPRFIAVGDFDQNGAPDLAVANYGSAGVTILLGDRTGKFNEAAGSPLNVGTNPFSVAVGDFNLNGKPDLAVANYGSNNVTILLGHGRGVFTQPAGSPVAAGNGPHRWHGRLQPRRQARPRRGELRLRDVTILLGNRRRQIHPARRLADRHGDWS